MRNVLGTIALAALVGGSLGATAQKVQTDYDHKADFAAAHTFCIARVHTTDPLFESRLREAITLDLTRDGFQNVTGVMKRRQDPGAAPIESPAACDLAVTAVGKVRTQQEYSTFYNDFGPGWGWGGWPGWAGGWGWGMGGGPAVTDVRDIPVGTLVVDIYNNHTKRLMFRGVATDTVSDHPSTNTRRLNIAVDKMFRKFPPKPGK